VFYRGGEEGVDVMVRRECAKEAVGADELRGSDAGHEGVRGKMRGDAAKFRMSGKDLAQDLFILFGLEGTGGIDEAAARRETGQRRREERNLAAMKVREVGGLESPADFRIARESAGAGAGSVNEDAIEFAAKGERTRGVEGDESDVRGIEPGESLAHGAEAMLVKIGGDEERGWAGRARERERLAAGGGAEVEDGIARMDIEEERDELGGFVLE